MSLLPFLQSLESALSQPSASKPFICHTLYHPTRTQPSAANEILVGLGAWMRNDTPVRHCGVCLNNKGAAGRFGTPHRYPSVTDLVLDPPPELLREWRALAGAPADPAALLARFTVVVEDVGPDSCFGLLCWLALMGGVEANELREGPVGRWVDAVRRWEMDGVCEDPFASWPALLSALSHSYVPARSERSEPLSEAAPELGTAWREALRLTVALLRAGCDPEAVPARPQLPAWSRAIAFMKSEQRDYLETLPQALRLQLLVPMAGTGDACRLLVDAWFAVEGRPSGVKKVFIRNDREHTHTGSGFALMGVYRPDEAGSGNDMTLSVDPRTGIDLKALWQALEQRESEAWLQCMKRPRPSQSPRDIVSYRGGNGYDQPWWDDDGRYTLLGAPKAQPRSGIPGSLLDWKTVVDTVWRCYHPLRGLTVFDRLDGDAERPLEACRTEPVRCDTGGPVAVTRRLAAVRWKKSGEPQNLFLCPTAYRFLAALVCRRTPGEPVSVWQLPAPDSLDVVALNGGFAVIHAQGALLFDDWRSEPIQLDALHEEFRRATELLAQTNASGAELDALLATAGGAGAATSLKTAIGLLSRLVRLRARLARVRQRCAPATAAEDVQRFRRQLERRWGIDHRIGDLHARIGAIEEAERALGTLRSQGLIGIIASYGLPFFISSALFVLAAPAIDALLDGPASGAALLAKIGGYFVVALLLVAVARVIQRRLVEPDRSPAEREHTRTRRRTP